MFCENCGNQIPDEMTNCPNCGAEVKAPEAAPVAPAAPVEVVAAPTSPLNLKAIVAIALAAIIVIIAGIAIFGAGNPESVAKKYAKASIDGDMLKAQKYCVIKGEKLDKESLKVYCEEEDMSKKEAFEEVEEEFEDMVDSMDMDMKVSIKSIKDIYKFYKDATEERYEEEYGKKYKISLEVKDCDKLKKSELKDKLESFEESLEYQLDDSDKDVEDFIKIDKIKEGYSVEIEYEIEGDEDFEGSRVVTVVKYKGKWKVLTTGSAM